jgi:hypothetical protein
MPAPIADPVPAQSRTLPLFTYQMQRTRSRSLKGKRLHFQLNKDSTMLLHTKLKSDNPTLIFIGKGSSMHFSSGEFAGAVFVQENATNFSVRRTSQYGEELATIGYSRKFTVQKPKSPRVVAVRLFVHSADLPDRLLSRKPNVSCVGEWSLDFGSRPGQADAGFLLIFPPHWVSNE